MTYPMEADGDDHVIPGHDPLVGKRFPRWNGDPHIACLHEPPADDGVGIDVLAGAATAS
ncbi:hypothetical protein [Noviherbaspirillum denitrificans]|uniref:hypothetical protein n=1 Tax=Noviherbaspirillum denitrificans TaxID=1968433 RepID=UPI001481EB3C|nr:hypothetical protein [Noviherbaspirillum denitrificans]